MGTIESAEWWKGLRRVGAPTFGYHQADDPIFAQSDAAEAYGWLGSGTYCGVCPMFVQTAERRDIRRDFLESNGISDELWIVDSMDARNVAMTRKLGTLEYFSIFWKTDEVEVYSKFHDALESLNQGGWEELWATPFFLSQSVLTNALVVPSDAEVARAILSAEEDDVQERWQYTLHGAHHDVAWGRSGMLLVDLWVSEGSTYCDLHIDRSDMDGARDLFDGWQKALAREGLPAIERSKY